jgi:nitrate/TMAO reductase-like tetraheme cytochrome c subunit
MKLRDLSFIGMVALVIGGLQTLSFVNKPPSMPKDIHHTIAGRNARAHCLFCHQPEALLELEQANRHPRKWRDARSDCLLCHIPASGAKWKAEQGIALILHGVLERQKYSPRIYGKLEKE